MAWKLLGSFGFLWIGILLGNLYPGKVVGRNCELRPFVFASLGSDWRYSSGLEIVRKFGDFLWIGILLGNLYPGKVVGRNCELRPLY